MKVAVQEEMAVVVAAAVSQLSFQSLNAIAGDRLVPGVQLPSGRQRAAGAARKYTWERWGAAYTELEGLSSKPTDEVRSAWNAMTRIAQEKWVRGHSVASHALYEEAEAPLRLPGGQLIGGGRRGWRWG